MRRIFLLVPLLAAACTRNPEGSGESEAYIEPAQAPQGATARPTAAPQGQALPGGHPPIGNAGEGTRTPFDASAPAVAGMRFTVSAPLVHRAPQSPMRLAEYVVEGSPADDEALMTVFHFAGMGGEVRENIDRWVRQFRTPEGGPVVDAQIETRTVGGLAITTVDASGTFFGQAAVGGSVTPRPDQRMLAAVVVAPEGPVFFKLVGPSADVTRASAAFEQLLGSVEKSN